MNPHISQLHSYPFEKLQQIKQALNPLQDKPHIALSVGEPKHATPDFVRQSIRTNVDGLMKYPTTRGTPELRTAIADWLIRRFNLTSSALDIEQNILPVSGTREGLFSIAQTVIDRHKSPIVIMPNPFYQIYEGAALLAGAEPYYLNTCAENEFLPDLDSIPDHVWKRCQLFYSCSPGNPHGRIIPLDMLQRLIELAMRHDFVIAADECYSEIYLDELKPPAGLLQAAAAMGNDSFSHCLVFHSLSKRSNAPGLRSGFVAGDAQLIRGFFQYRTYHGCALPVHTQMASTLAWKDEDHVRTNRILYRDKFRAVTNTLKGAWRVTPPEASFYLWPETPLDDQQFAKMLYQQENITVLPGSFLSREVAGINPGSNRVRIALVAPLDECIDAAQRIQHYFSTL